ncbi:LOW QUALITY PROTEIN: hypothetical protein U9M48_000631 [Paspalum notatum var. saurae]|uniref:Uncharacterized protein n=1 Tax=Paspalum notatum var. saurae TaxID=547442 RepID=A0AAQ3PFE2_PASNO
MGPTSQPLTHSSSLFASSACSASTAAPPPSRPSTWHDELLALDALQAHVADRLQALYSAGPSGATLLSLPFLFKLLDAVLSSNAAFRTVLTVGPVAAALARPPADLLDRAVKALDVLNAASQALASLCAALTAASCLLAPSRARRALARLFPDGKYRRPPAPCSVSTPPAANSAPFAPPPARRPPPAHHNDQASAAIGAPASPPKQAQWAAPMAVLQDRVGGVEAESGGSSRKSAPRATVGEERAREVTERAEETERGATPMAHRRGGRRRENEERESGEREWVRKVDMWGPRWGGPI